MFKVKCRSVNGFINSKPIENYISIDTIYRVYNIKGNQIIGQSFFIFSDIGTWEYIDSNCFEEVIDE